MNKITLFRKAAVIILSAMLFIGCSKHGSMPSKPKCHMNNISTGGVSYLITYNADGKINTVSRSDGFVYSYTYTENTMVQNVTNNGAFYWKLTSNLNASGLPISSVTNYDEAGTKWRHVNYEYDGILVSKATITAYNSPAPVVVSYTNDGNNIVSVDYGSSGIMTFSYYNDKPRQPGGVSDYNTLTGGGVIITGFDASIFRNKNLMKSVTSNGKTANILYDFDADGKIMTMTINATGYSAQLVQYQYECK